MFMNEAISSVVEILAGLSAEKTKVAYIVTEKGDLKGIPFTPL